MDAARGGDLRGRRSGREYDAYMVGQTERVAWPRVRFAAEKVEPTGKIAVGITRRMGSIAAGNPDEHGR
jgi:hypothetical protein